MTIRKRIEEAIALERAGFAEASLILSLVAVAAAARKKYPRSTHRDGEAFKTYLNERGGKLIGFPYKGKQKSVADVLYEEYRCNLIHEAELPKHLKFDSEPGNMGISLNGDEIILGGGWRRWLIGAVVNDHNLKDDFEDMRSFTLDDLKFTVGDRGRWLKELEEKYSISEGRLFLVFRLIYTVGISRLNAMTDEGILALGAEIRKEPAIAGLNQGGITGLSRFTTPFPNMDRPESFFDENGITKMGLNILRELLTGICE